MADGVLASANSTLMEGGLIDTPMTWDNYASVIDEVLTMNEKTLAAARKKMVRTVWEQEPSFKDSQLDIALYLSATKTNHDLEAALRLMQSYDPSMFSAMLDLSTASAKQTVHDELKYQAENSQDIADVRALKNSLAQIQYFVSSVNQYTNGVATAADGAHSAKDGAAQLADGTKTLYDGVTTLNDGAGQLSDGTVRLNDEMCIRDSHLPTELAIGVILVGTCPGGTSSNVMTYLSKGDVALSVGMTAVSTVLAPFLTPLLTLLYAGQRVDVNPVNMFLSIVKVVPVSYTHLAATMWSLRQGSAPTSERRSFTTSSAASRDCSRASRFL